MIVELKHGACFRGFDGSQNMESFKLPSWLLVLGGSVERKVCALGAHELLLGVAEAALVPVDDGAHHRGAAIDEDVALVQVEVQ